MQPRLKRKKKPKKTSPKKDQKKKRPIIRDKRDSAEERGRGIAQWLEHRTRDWKVAGSNPCWNGGRIFFSRVNFLCWLLFRYPFHPRVTAVARKKSRSFCQKCRWQVTAKTRIHLTYVDFIEPCFGIGHNLSLICQMTSEDIKHQLIIISAEAWFSIALRPRKPEGSLGRTAQPGRPPRLSHSSWTMWLIHNAGEAGWTNFNIFIVFSVSFRFYWFRRLKTEPDKNSPLFVSVLY